MTTCLVDQHWKDKAALSASFNAPADAWIFIVPKQNSLVRIIDELAAGLTTKSRLGEATVEIKAKRRWDGRLLVGIGRYGVDFHSIVLLRREAGPQGRRT